jgi:hypothetical protein
MACKRKFGGPATNDGSANPRVEAAAKKGGGSGKGSDKSPFTSAGGGGAETRPFTSAKKNGGKASSRGRC